jgi:hypothetical protein
MRWRTLAALLVVTMAPLAGAADSPTVALDNCIMQLDPEVDVGYERIAAICPRLAQALEQSGFAQWLPLGWKESRNNLSAGSLVELRAVVERELATRPAARVPNVEHLNNVLAGLGNQPVQTSGAWGRFKKWLRDLMDRRERPTDENWFDRMVSRGGVSAAVGEVLTYIALGAVVVLALIVVFNELKAAGLLGRRKRDGNEEGEGDSPLAHVVPTMGDIEKAPLIERPAMWLELIASKLTTMGRLPPANALTVREMERSAHLQDAQDRKRLSALALTAERARFAQESVPATVLEQAVDDGRALFESVSNLQEAERESPSPDEPTR